MSVTLDEAFAQIKFELAKSYQTFTEDNFGRFIGLDEALADVTSSFSSDYEDAQEPPSGVFPGSQQSLRVYQVALGIVPQDSFNPVTIDEALAQVRYELARSYQDFAFGYGDPMTLEQGYVEVRKGYLNGAAEAGYSMSDDNPFEADGVWPGLEQVLRVYGEAFKVDPYQV